MFKSNQEAYSASHRRTSVNKSLSTDQALTSKIELLVTRVKELELENAELKEYNRRLLGDDETSVFKSTDVHSFYQDVFITDLNKEIHSINEEAGVYKKQISEQAMQIEKLQKEVQHLNKVVNRYRNTVNELSK